MDYAKLMDRIQSGINSSVSLSDDEQPVSFMGDTGGRWDDDKIIRTGSLSLDMAIGVGGWPRGRVCEIYGEESSGKTTQCLLSVGHAQKQGIPVVYIDAENALDPSYMKKLGVDVQNLAISQTSILQDVINLALGAMNVFAEEGIGGLIVFDSIPNMVDRAIYEADADKQTMASAARVWSQQMPKIVTKARKTGTTVLCINQVRENIGSYMGGVSTPGGRALKFVYSVRVAIRRRVEGRNNEDGADGQTIFYKVEKNKVGSPYVKRESYLPAGQPIDWVLDVLEEGVNSGVIIKDMKGTEEDGKVFLESKKAWHTYILSREEVDFYNETMPGIIEERRENGEDVDDFEPIEYGHFISKYQRGNFDKVLLADYDILLPFMEQRILNTLSEDDTIADEFIWSEDDEKADDIEEVDEDDEDEESEETDDDDIEDEDEDEDGDDEESDEDDEDEEDEDDE